MEGRKLPSEILQQRRLEVIKATGIRLGEEVRRRLPAIQKGKVPLSDAAQALPVKHAKEPGSTCSLEAKVFHASTSFPGHGKGKVALVNALGTGGFSLMQPSTKFINPAPVPRSPPHAIPHWVGCRDVGTGFRIWL